MTRPFARVARPDAWPGHCLRCPRNEDLIDLGADPLIQYGVAYLCSVCFFEMITAAGLVERATYDMTVAEYQNRLIGMEAQLTRARAAVPADGITPTPHEVEHLDGIRDLLDRLTAAGRPGGGRDAVAAPASAGAARERAGVPGGGEVTLGLGHLVDAGIPLHAVGIPAWARYATDVAEPDGVDHSTGFVREGIDPFASLEPRADDEAAGLDGDPAGQ